MPLSIGLGYGIGHGGGGSPTTYTIEQVGNQFEITYISTDPADEDVLQPVLTINAVAYPAVTYGDLRAIVAGTPEMLGTVSITFDGDVGDLTVDDVLTGNEGPVLYSGSAPTPARTWEADNIPIGGATATTFTLTASEQGTAVTFVSDPDSGGAGVAVESAAVNIPAGAGASASLVKKGSAYEDNDNLGTDKAIATVLAATGGEYFIAIGYGTNGSGIISTVDIGGTSATLVTSSYATGAATSKAAWYRIPALTTTNGNLNVALDTGQWRGFSAVIYEGTDVTSYSAVTASDASYGAMDGSINTATGGHVAAVATLQDEGTTGGIAWAGITQNEETPSQSTRLMVHADASVTTGETPRTITATPDGDGASAVCLSVLEVQ